MHWFMILVLQMRPGNGSVSPRYSCFFDPMAKAAYLLCNFLEFVPL